jgi:hypothetical protein
MAILGLGRMPANPVAAFAGTQSPSRLINSDLTMGREFDSSTINAVPKYGGKTIAEGGKSPAMAASDKAEAAWQEAMALLQKQGPYTPAVVNQLTNRRADQTAAAEAVNAEEIRNQAAARGMDPSQAIRGLQQGRQAQNVAFSGDIASQAAVQNYAAEAPGRMMAAQANLNRQFGGGTQPAVSGGGVPTVAPPAPRPAPVGNTAFSSTARGGQGPMVAGNGAPVQKKPLSVAERNALQTAWARSGGKTINGTAGKPATGPLQVAAAQTPIQYGNTAFGPVSTAENARSYQNIYKYTN